MTMFLLPLVRMLVGRGAPSWLANALAALLPIVLIVAVLGTAKCAYDRRVAAQAEADSRLAEGRTTSAGEAINTVAGAGTREAEIDAQGRENENAIRATEGGRAPVPDDANAAGLRALCMRPAYHATERCRRLLGDDPGDVALANPRR